MLEEMIRKLVDLPMMERCFIALILTTDDESAWTYMTRVNEHPDLRTFAVVEACRVGSAAEKGKRREEFLTDLLASLDVKAVV